MPRAHPRYAITVDISVTVEETTFTAQSENLSMGGLCLETSQGIELGQQVALHLALVFPENNNSEPIKISGRVVWSTAINQHHQIGIQFTDISPETTSDLALFLRFLASERGYSTSR